MSRFPFTSFWAFVAASALLASCGSSEQASSDSQASSEAAAVVVFEASGDPVALAGVIPLAGFAHDNGELSGFVVDVNTNPTETDDDGRFTFDYRQVPEIAGLQITVEVPSAVGPAVGRLDYRTLFAPEAAPVDIEIVEPTLCTPSVDCGEEMLPDLVPIIGWDGVSAETYDRLFPATLGPPDAGLFPEETFFVSEENGRTLLRFATVAANLGDGPLDVIAAPGSADGSPTWQRIWTDTWHFQDIAAGEFIYHPTHDHIHFDAFERYRLLQSDGTVVASAEKVSFCLRDSVRVADAIPAVTGPMLADLGDCAGQQQVINVGFGDHYHALLDDQWIDITDVPAGDYIVEIAVDPENRLRESNEENNIGTFTVTIG